MTSAAPPGSATRASAPDRERSHASPKLFGELADRIHEAVLVHRDVILHAKRVNGYFVVAEEVRDRRGILSLSTLYKKSAPPLARDAGQGPTPLPTSETIQSAAQRILQQVTSQHNFFHGGTDGGNALGAASPEPFIDEEES